MKKSDLKTNNTARTPEKNSVLIVEIGDAKKITGGNSSGNKNDGFSTSSHYKDPRGGAGETAD